MAWCSHLFQQLVKRINSVKALQFSQVLCASTHTHIHLGVDYLLHSDDTDAACVSCTLDWFTGFLLFKKNWRARVGDTRRKSGLRHTFRFSWHADLLRAAKWNRKFIYDNFLTLVMSDEIASLGRKIYSAAYRIIPANRLIGTRRVKTIGCKYPPSAPLVIL